MRTERDGGCCIQVREDFLIWWHFLQNSRWIWVSQKRRQQAAGLWDSQCLCLKWDKPEGSNREEAMRQQMPNHIITLLATVRTLNIFLRWNTIWRVLGRGGMWFNLYFQVYIAALWETVYKGARREAETNQRLHINLVDSVQVKSWMFTLYNENPQTQMGNI
jgi:hypothetical protein